MFKRYPSEAIAVTFILVIMFYSLFLGARYMAGPTVEFGDRLDAIVVGYVIWLLVVGVFAGMATDIQTEAQTGTLEQLVITGRGMTRLFIWRSIASMFLNLLITLAVLFIIKWLVGAHLTFTPLILIPVVPILIGTIGLGFLMGSVTIIVKKTTALIATVQMGLIFLIMAPVENWDGIFGWIMKLLPISQATGLLRQVMARGETLETGQVLMACGINLVWLVLGILVFRAAFNKARQQGTLGDY